MEAQPTSEDVTGLLRLMEGGDRDAGDRLYDVLYPYLRDLAHAQMRRSTAGTMQPTALVHEAWLRLSNGSSPDWRDRQHFLATAARAMRSALVDRARRRQALKRDGCYERVPLDETLEVFESRAGEMLELDEALQRLAGLDARAASVVELCFFGGLTIPEAAQALDVSRATAERSWYVARSWLRDELAR